VLLEGIKELEQKIEDQTQALAEAQQQYEQIKKENEKWKNRRSITKKIIEGKFEIIENQQTQEYESRVRWKGTQIRITKEKDQDTTREKTLQIGKEHLERVQTKLSKLQKQKRYQEKLVEAHKQKLTIMQKELKKLETDV
jgi:hypothetical protein